MKEKLLSAFLDDENSVEAPGSDSCNSDSACDFDETDFDWCFQSNEREQFTLEEADNPDEDNGQLTELHCGLHWEVGGEIKLISPKK